MIRAYLIWKLLLPVLVVAGAVPAYGQRRAAVQLDMFPGTSRFELSDTVQLDRADSTVLAHLERIKAYLADRQWDEAVETLQRVMESAEDKLLGVTERRYISVRDYGHLQLAALGDEALRLYRNRVDPLARKWYEEGVEHRNRGPLLSVLREAFAGRWGDDALLALGEMALESGDYTQARWYWERILPTELPAGVPRTWPGYPDTDLDPAAVRARLVMTSILEGSTARGRDELAQLKRLHGDARGRFGGREVNYTEALEAMLADSAAWPVPEPSSDWPTFAGSTLRNTTTRKMIDTGPVAWRIALGGSDIEAKPGAALGFHPVLVGGMVLVNNLREIMAVDAADGKPVWKGSKPVIYRPEFEGAAGMLSVPSGALGTPQYTMTVSDGKLYARMGSPVTGLPVQPMRSVRPGHLVCLDLASQGWLMWKIMPEKGWAFEGSPVVEGRNVYIAMRRNDVRPQAYVACFDAQTGRRRWRRFICGAETPARGLTHQITHNLLSLAAETLYFNTNLGAIAALSARDGAVKWVSLYPRALTGDLAKPAPHWRRQLNPCLVDHGTLLVAPADSPRIFAFDAATGQMLWQTDTKVQDVQHLLGTTDEHLIAAGSKLYWIALDGAQRGRIKHVWPDGPEKPGYGRGILAADNVLWPTRERIYVFDQKTARPKRVIDLVPYGVTGGNLLVASGRLLIATATELIALDRHSGVQKEKAQGMVAKAN